MDDFRQYYLDEIMKLESDNSVNLMNSLLILKPYVEVKLENDEKYNIFYSCKVSDILKSDISNEELIEIRNGGWEYSDNKEMLIKKL